MKAVTAAVATATVRQTATDVRAAVADAVHRHKVRGFGNGNARGNIGCRSKDWRVQNDFLSLKFLSLNKVHC